MACVHDNLNKLFPTTYYIFCVYTVAVILYYITICLYITGSMASMLIAIIKTLVVVVW
jgi:hypothetical protein